MSFTLEESVLQFLFFDNWNDESEEWWKANFSEFLDILPKHLKSVDPTNIVGTLRKHLLKSLNESQHSKN